MGLQREILEFLTEIKPTSLPTLNLAVAMKLSEATFTQDRFETDPNGSGPKIGPDRLLFTRDRSGTGPKRIQTDPKLHLLQLTAKLVDTLSVAGAILDETLNFKLLLRLPHLNVVWLPEPCPKFGLQH